MAVLHLAWKSLLNRRHSALLTLLSIALSTALLLGVERLRVEARTAFTQSVSGTDLLVGARTGPINLLLYSLFHIGHPSHALSWQAYRRFADDPRVAWSIPFSLGDSHKGYRLVGTDSHFFSHFRYGNRQLLQLASGKPFEQTYDVVSGAEVAHRLGYAVGDRIVMAHGAGEVSFSHHDDRPFRISGILQPTGTPVDRALYVSLKGIEAMHFGWQAGASHAAMQLPAPLAARLAQTPDQISAFLLGLHNRTDILVLQRDINQYADEALSGLLPVVALQQLWQIMSVAERALLAMSTMVVLVGMVGMLSLMLSGLNERRREMAILRALGARPAQVLLLILGESLVLTLAGLLLGLLLLYAALWLGQPLIQTYSGFLLPLSLPGAQECFMLGGILLAGLLLGLIPAYRAYHHALGDGMSIRL
jgi:putative ABC transport system permease protein